MSTSPISLDSLPRCRRIRSRGARSGGQKPGSRRLPAGSAFLGRIISIVAPRETRSGSPQAESPVPRASHRPPGCPGFRHPERVKASHTIQRMAWFLAGIAMLAAARQPAPESTGSVRLFRLFCQEVRQHGALLIGFRELHGALDDRGGPGVVAEPLVEGRDPVGEAGVLGEEARRVV